MNIAGVEFSTNEVILLDELATEDLAYTMECVLNPLLKVEGDLWAAVEDCYRLMYRLAFEELSACDLGVLADLAEEEYVTRGREPRWDSLYGKLAEAYDLMTQEAP